MALINRVSRLFKADLHAVLDRIEEPNSLLRQSLREMEEALQRARRRRQQLASKQSEVRAREKELAVTLQALEEELGTCFEFGRDDLARSQIKRKLEFERQKQLLSRRRQEIEATLRTLQGRIDEDSTRLQSMRQKAELLESDDEHVTDTQRTFDFPADLTVSDDEVEVAFLREKRRRAQR